MKNIGQEAYKLLLQDARWMRKAYYIKKRDNNKCVICGSKNNLHVHHLNYGDISEPWNVPNEWLCTLCDSHHEQVHKGKVTIDYPKIGRFYKSHYGNIGVVLKIDRQTSNIIMLSQHPDKELSPKLTKIRFCYFCESWNLIEQIDESMANWFYLYAMRFSKSVKILQEKAIDETHQSTSVGDFEDCFITMEDIAYSRKVLQSLTENFVIPAVRPIVGNFYSYWHSDYRNECLCVRIGEINGFDDIVYMVEYDFGGSGLWIGGYTNEQFHGLQCANNKMDDMTEAFWDAIVSFLKDGEYNTCGFLRFRLHDDILNAIKSALFECVNNNDGIADEIKKAEDRRLYQ